jgi:dihydrofolate synthase/folylpolyglutamate synthase
MKYGQAVRYLESFQRSGIRLGLERITSLLARLGNPQDSFRSIHIAGTNGKGSVAAMLSSILYRSGYRVGLYTSPHLVDYTERIRINEKDISKAKFAAAVAKVKEAIDELPEMRLTEFEVLTAVGFLLLAQEKIDIAVIEVGLGGRLDATNVITPIFSVITNIDYDHMDVLGRSISKIAKEKAGIIKPGVTLVTGETKVWRILYNICKKNGSKFVRSNKIEVKYAPMLGSHQVENTKIALASIEVLRELGVKINGKQIDLGLRGTSWPGRLQMVSKKPLIILDGSHNPAGAITLADFLSSYGKKFTFIIGMQANKDIKSFVKTIKPLASDFIVVRSSNPGAAPNKIVADRIRSIGFKPVIAGSLKSAVSKVKESKDPICITGSLYLVGDALKQKLFDL